MKTEFKKWLEENGFKKDDGFYSRTHKTILGEFDLTYYYDKKQYVRKSPYCFAPMPRGYYENDFEVETTKSKFLKIHETLKGLSK